MNYQTVVSFRLDRDIISKLDALSKQHRLSRGEVLRRAVASYVSSDVNRRLITLAEYTQLALDVLIEENHPARRKEIIAGVQQRLEQHHGLR